MKEFQETKNPYTLQFSFIPPKFIKRTLITSEIVSNFIRDVPTYRGIFITGVRGSGKTVILEEIGNQINALDDWVVLELNPETDLLNSLARGLYLRPEMKALFVKAKLDFSVLGLGIHMENADMVASDEEDAMKMMLSALKKAKKKILVTIDEVTYSKDVARFSHALSTYAGADYDIFLLMTGLRENINNIKNKKSLTFLYRAKVMELDTLNITAISNDYQRTLGLSREIADDLAFQSKGYSLAYQTIGYHYWRSLSRLENNEKINIRHLWEDVDATLSELAYDKIWDELSANDKKVISTMALIEKKNGQELIRVEDIRTQVKMTSDSFTTYRKRLIDAGLVDGSQFGYLKFRLPRFEQYIERKRYE